MRNVLTVVQLQAEYDAIACIVPGIRHASIGVRLPMSVAVSEESGRMYYLTRAGIGAVHTVAHVVALNEHVPLDAVIMLGVGGALDEQLNIGDIVIGGAVMQHDAQYVRENEVCHMAAGAPYMSVAPEQRLNPLMKADPVLHSLAIAACCRTPAVLADCYSGTVISGSAFVADPHMKRQLAALADDAIVIDMESAAMGQLARDYGLPFITIRAISDRLAPVGVSVEHDYTNSLGVAAAESAKVYVELLRVLGDHAVHL